jgi:hypothetical protein
MASFLDVCRFFPTAGGTTDWTVSAAVGGYQTPSAAGAVNGALYRYRAESTDLTQWEVGYGTYNTSTSVLSRSTVLFNSAGTTAKIGFSTVPQVAIVALAEDIGGNTNRRLAKTAAYTVAQADCGMTLALGGGAFYALTFAAGSGYDSNHTNLVINEDTARGKLLLPVYTTSSSSLTIGTGSKAFTVSAGLNFPSTSRFRAYSLANSANFMAGSVSYSGTTLTMTVDTIGGSGTFTDWQIAPEIILWPKQTVTVFNDNNIWVLDKPNQLWFPETNSPTFNVDPTNGSDSNDGLGTTTGAVKTLNRAATLAYNFTYTRNFGSIIIDGGSNTFQEFVQVFYPLNGGGTLIFQNLTWRPANSGYCLQFGDGALVGLTSVTFNTTSVTTPVGYITGHNHGVLDVNTGVSFTTGGISGSVFSADFDSHFNINNGLTLTNAISAIGGFLYDGNGPRTVWNINGTHTFVTNPNMGRFAWASRGSVMEFQGNVVFSGTVTAGVSLVNQTGVLLNMSGATLPGGTPTPTTGGQYNTSSTA